MPIGANAPRDTSFDCTVKSERFDPRGGMTGDRCRQQNCAMAAPVLGIDSDNVRLGQVGVAVGIVGAGMVDIVRHPPKRCRAVELNVALLKSRFLLSDLQTIAEDVGTVRLFRDQAGKGLPKAAGEAG